MISKGIALLIVALVTVGGIGFGTVLLINPDQSDEITFPIDLADEADDIMFVTSDTWNKRGVPDGPLADVNDEFSEYYQHIDIISWEINQTSKGLESNMELRGDVIISEGVVYGYYIELESISYTLYFIEGEYYCFNNNPQRNVDWWDWYNQENNSMISDFAVDENNISFTLDIQIEPEELQYLLCISGYGEYEWYFDYLEFMIVPEKISDEEMPSTFDKIQIRGDTDFTKDNGVSRGNGTEDNPYIIEDLTVTGEFMLQYTTKYLEVRNIKIKDDGSIRLFGSNVKVINLSVNSTSIYGLGISGSNVQVHGFELLSNNLSTGISISGGDNILVSGADIKDCRIGISIMYPENVTIDNCVISNCSYAGFDIQNSGDIKITNCTITKMSSYAIYPASTVDSIHIDHCDIIDNVQGIWLHGPNSKVTYCNIIDSSPGFRLERDCVGLIIKYNNIEGSGLYWQTIESLKPVVYISDNYWSDQTYDDTNPSPIRIENTGPISP